MCVCVFVIFFILILFLAFSVTFCVLVCWQILKVNLVVNVKRQQIISRNIFFLFYRRYIYLIQMILKVNRNCFYLQIRNSAWGLIDFTEQSLWFVYPDKIVFDFFLEIKRFLCVFNFKDSKIRNIYLSWTEKHWTKAVLKLNLQQKLFILMNLKFDKIIIHYESNFNFIYHLTVKLLIKIHDIQIFV